MKVVLQTLWLLTTVLGGAFLLGIYVRLLVWAFGMGWAGP